MAKSSTLAAVMGVLLVVATATATTLKVEVEEEDNQRRRGGGCSDQMQRAQMLNDCQDFLMEVSQGGGRSMQCGYGGSRRGAGQGSRGSYHLDACCDQLSQMDEQCMCEGLRQLVMQEQGRFHGPETQQMVQCARQLPRMCGMGQSCSQIRAPVSI